MTAQRHPADHVLPLQSFERRPLVQSVVTSLLLLMVFTPGVIYPSYTKIMGLTGPWQRRHLCINVYTSNLPSGNYFHAVSILQDQ